MLINKSGGSKQMGNIYMGLGIFILTVASLILYFGWY